MNPDDDEIDRLFALAAAPPPGDVGSRALARLRAVRGARRLTLIALVDGAALLVLAALAFLLGAALGEGDLPALVELALEDRALVIESRWDLAVAFLRSVPWPYVAAIVLDALLLHWLTSRLLRATAAVATGPAGSRP